MIKKLQLQVVVYWEARLLTVYDISDEALTTAKERIQALKPLYQADLKATTEMQYMSVYNLKVT